MHKEFYKSYKLFNLTHKIRIIALICKKQSLHHVTPIKLTNNDSPNTYKKKYLSPKKKKCLTFEPKSLHTPLTIKSNRFKIKSKTKKNYPNKTI